MAVGKVWVGTVTEEECAHLTATLGGCLMHGSKLPEISGVHLSTILGDVRAGGGMTRRKNRHRRTGERTK